MFDKRPNVLLVVADAMRADAIGKTINGIEVTPRLNRLAQTGTCFTNAYSTSSQTKFSVPSIMTGLYPPGHKVERYAHTLPDAPTMQKFFSERGYRTLAIVTNPFLETEDVSPHYGKLDFGFGQDFDTYTYVDNPERKAANLSETDKFLCQYATGAAVNAEFGEVLSKQARSKQSGRVPFYAYVHYMDTHEPWMPLKITEGITGRFSASGVDLERRLKEDRLLLSQVLLKNDKTVLKDPGRLEALKLLYYESALYADTYIGELLDMLKAYGLLDETIIIVTSDHGDELFEHGEIGHAVNLYEPALRVPLIFSGGDFGGGRRIDHRISQVAVFPTVMELFGAQHAAQSSYSLMPMMSGSYDDDVDIYSALFEMEAGIDRDGIKAHISDKHSRAFDIERDPLESTPVDMALADKAVQVCSRTRQASELEGITRRFSSLSWQNANYPEQRRRARAEYIVRIKDKREEGKEQASWAQYEKRISLGEFMPPEEEGQGTSDTGIDASILSPEQAERLRALGYIK